MSAKACAKQLRGDVLYEIGVEDVENLRWHPTVRNVFGKSPQAWKDTDRPTYFTGRSMVEATVGKRPSSTLGFRKGSMGRQTSGRPTSAMTSYTFGQRSSSSHARQITPRPGSAAVSHRAATPSVLAASVRNTAEVIQSTVCSAGDRIFGPLVNRLDEMDWQMEQLFDGPVSSRPSTRPGTAMSRPGTAMSMYEPPCVPNSSDVPAPWALLSPRSKPLDAKVQLEAKANDAASVAQAAGGAPAGKSASTGSASEDVLQNLQKAREKLEKAAREEDEEEEEGLTDLDSSEEPEVAESNGLTSVVLSRHATSKELGKQTEEEKRDNPEVLVAAEASSKRNSAQDLTVPRRRSTRCSLYRKKSDGGDTSRIASEVPSRRASDHQIAARRVSNPQSEAIGASPRVSETFDCNTEITAKMSTNVFVQNSGFVGQLPGHSNILPKPCSMGMAAMSLDSSMACSSVMNGQLGTIIDDKVTPSFPNTPLIAGMSPNIAVSGAHVSSSLVAPSGQPGALGRTVSDQLGYNSRLSAPACSWTCEMNGYRRLSQCIVQPGIPSTLEQDAKASEIAAVCRSRAGAVLRKQSILKCDHFPSGRNKKLPVQLDQAPNYRKVQDLPIYGVAQPTVDGCVEVLHEIRNSEPNMNRIFWINCREEPVIYINGRPYACRDRNNPYTNLETVGIEPDQLQDLEEQLRQEILEEAKRYNGRILLHGERIPKGDDAVAAIGEMYAYWEPVQETFTPSEVFEQLREQFPELQFERLPITDEHAPEEKDFDDLVAMLAPALQENEYCGLVFNCQLGRGRTTTGMVLGVLLSHLPTFDKGTNFKGLLPGERPNFTRSRDGSRPTELMVPGTIQSQQRMERRKSECGIPSTIDPGSPGTRQYRAASILPEEIEYGGFEFAVIMQLLNKMSSGPTARRWVDGAIEACNHMVNLRKVLFDRKKRMESATDEKKRAKERTVLIDFIERYVYLILFSQYLKTEIELIECGNKSFPQSQFRDWMQDLHEKISVYELLDDIERAV